MSYLISKDTETLNGIKYKGRITRKGVTIVEPVAVPDEYVSYSSSGLAMTKINDWQVYDASEGTLIRAWFDHFANEWKLSTQCKLDAYDSRWGCNTTFGVMFDKDVDQYHPSLWQDMDTNYIYHYIVETRAENRIVLVDPYGAPPQSRLIYLGRNKIGVYGVWYAAEEEPCVMSGLRRAQRVYLETWDQIESLLPTASVGLFLRNSITGRTIKLWNEEYYEALELRGNEPSHLRRYLFLLITNPDCARKFLDLYSEMGGALVQASLTFHCMMQALVFVYNSKYCSDNPPYITVGYGLLQAIRKSHKTPPLAALDYLFDKRHSSRE